MNYNVKKSTYTQKEIEREADMNWVKHNNFCQVSMIVLHYILLNFFIVFFLFFAFLFMFVSLFCLVLFSPL